MTCKRSKQCDNADICRFAQSDDYNLLGGSCFTPKDPQTNDEWRRTCSTEEFAEWLFELGCDFGFCNHEVRCKDCANPWKCMSEPEYIVDWLKEKHNEM